MSSLIHSIHRSGRRYSLNEFGSNFGVTTQSLSATVANFSFETPIISGFQYSPTGSSWNINSASGLTVGNNTWLGTAVQDGNQACFMQGAAAEISQSLTLVPGLTYMLFFYGIQRPTFSGLTCSVKIDTDIITTVIPPSTTVWTQYSASFTTRNNTALLTFSGLNTLGGDRSLVLDNIRIKYPVYV